MVRHLAQEKIRPRASEIDATGGYPQDIFEEFSRADLLGLCIPEEYGGSGAGDPRPGLAIEEVTKYSNVLGLMLLLTRLPTGPIMIAGTEEQKQPLPAGHRRGTQRAAFCLSEPGAGSDVAGMRTRASPTPTSTAATAQRHQVLDLGGHAGRLVRRLRQDRRPGVAAALGDRLRSCRADTPGVTRPRVDKKMGVKGIDTAEIVFDDVRVGPRPGHRRGFLAHHAVARTPCGRSSRRAGSASPRAR